ncbi:hypothetical protein [Roseomonas fluvialis]|uniref:Uncharacterized protein n=1 Tax=Roseomonas fluvialis TaxID=1750527 RepID=A0ABM7YAN0_9PROT|nr:hypothetical protein [Roseomonas fluvialis]BDG75114.1 hypothetical protein Rmf_50430 [Roseomonas fluvialis]
MSSGTPDLVARLALLLAVQAAAVLAWDALTRGPMATIPPDSVIGGLGTFWMVPAAWLAAWQVLALTDLRRALSGAAVTFVLCVVIFAVALVAGLFSAALLALPAGAVGVVLIARFIARREATEDGAPPRAWPHVVGLLVALAGLLPAVLSIGERFHPDIPPRAATAAGLALLLLPSVAIFLPHALLALAARPHGPAPWRRGAAMLAVVLAVPMPVLGPGWMFATPGRVAAEHAEHVLFSEAGGWERGYYPGQVMTADLGLRRFSLTVPQGWLGLHPPWPQPEPARAIEIVPDPRLPPPALPFRRLRIAPAVENPMVPVGAAGTGQADWHLMGCTAPDDQGISLCRQLGFRDGRETDAAMATLLPEETLTRRMLARYAIGPAAWRVLGPGLHGECYLRETCRLRFAVPDAIELEAEIPATIDPDLPQLRAGAAVLMGL